MRKLAIYLFVMSFVVACDVKDNAYTLYKTSDKVQGGRVFVNLFDVSSDVTENYKACFKAKLAFDEKKTEEEANVTYWCEKGDYATD